jgi:hypothetical protein
VEILRVCVEMRQHGTSLASPGMIKEEGHQNSIYWSKFIVTIFTSWKHFFVSHIYVGESGERQWTKRLGLSRDLTATIYWFKFIVTIFTGLKHFFVSHIYVGESGEHQWTKRSRPSRDLTATSPPKTLKH